MPRKHSNQDLQKIFRFLQFVDALKEVKRFKTNNTSDKKDTVASHVWRMAFMATLLGSCMGPKFNLLRALKMILMHDLPEIITDDISFDNVYLGKVKPGQKKRNEDRAMVKLSKMLPASLSRELISLWNEFEANKTPEAKFAQVMDKAEGSMHSLYMGTQTWGLPAPHIVFNNRACGLLEETDPFMRVIKAVYKKECRKAGIPWEKEYDGFSAT